MPSFLCAGGMYRVNEGQSLFGDDPFGERHIYVRL